MDRTRLRGRLVVSTLAIAMVGACTGRDPTGIDRLLLRDALLDPGEGPCYIGKVNPDPGGSPTWWGTSTPTVDTTCGVIVTFSFPRTNTPALWFRNYFYWIHVEQGLYPKSTGYQLGSYNDGINGPITYTFSQAISEFSMKVWGAGQNVDIGPGHYMLAYDAVSGGNLVDSVSFGPGVNNIYSLREDIRTVSDSTIRRVVVHMPRLGPDGNGDYSIPVNDRLRMRQATFVPAPCPPPNPPDSILGKPGIADSLKAAMQRSNPNAPPAQRMERGGPIWRLPNGDFLATELGSPYVTQNGCSFSLNSAGPPPVTGAVAVAIWHTHPHTNGERAYGCQAPPGHPGYSQTPGDGLFVPRVNPDANGGGSDDDWDDATTSTYDHYVITKSGRVSRLRPNTSRGSARAGNGNRWRWNNPSYPNCIV